MLHVLALLSTRIGSNYPCLELIYLVPKVFEPLKFDCIVLFVYLSKLNCLFFFLFFFIFFFFFVQLYAISILLVDSLNLFLFQHLFIFLRMSVLFCSDYVHMHIFYV